MVVGKAKASADRVGQSQTGAHLLEEPASESAAQNFVHHGDGRHIGIVAVDAKPDNLDIRLVHVILADEVHARRGAGKLDRGARGSGVTGGSPSKAARTLASIAAGSKSPLDANDQLSFERALVPGLEVIQGDSADGGQLRLPRVGAVTP